MARRKLTEEEKAEKARIKEEKRIAATREFNIKKAKEEMQFYPEIPIKYEVGEEVILGAHQNCKIIEVFENGKFYEVECYGTKRMYSELIEYNRKHIVDAYSLEKLSSRENKKLLAKRDKHSLCYSNMQISSILTNLFYFGTNMNPEYQRDYVWEKSDKISLIDSIFNDYDIGKFLFRKLPFKENSPSYEIVDGKQRLNAIKEFIEGKFKYNEFYWHELHPSDRDFFLCKIVSTATLDESLSDKEVMSIFYELNISGKVMSKEHLDKIKQML